MNGTITNRDLYDIIASRFDRLEKKIESCYERVGVLEIWKGQVAGYAAAIAGIIGLISALVISWIKDKLSGD